MSIKRARLATAGTPLGPREQRAEVIGVAVPSLRAPPRPWARLDISVLGEVALPAARHFCFDCVKEPIM
eukprot:14112160-Alexandrium_andersonii.AAC.1